MKIQFISCAEFQCHESHDLCGWCTYHERGTSIQRKTNCWRNPIDVGPSGIAEYEHASWSECSREDSRDETVFGFADAVLESVRLVNVPDQSAVDNDTESGADDDANEYRAHNADGVVVGFQVHNRE